jgi:hypothetical protein
MSYYVKENEGVFDIVEKETETLIDLKTTEKRARDLCRKMNLGAGFNGFTPMFFADLRGLETAD